MCRSVTHTPIKYNQHNKHLFVLVCYSHKHRQHDKHVFVLVCYSHKHRQHDKHVSVLVCYSHKHRQHDKHVSVLVCYSYKHKQQDKHLLCWSVTYTSISSMTNTFHRAMKIRIILRLSKNSRTLSPAGHTDRKTVSASVTSSCQALHMTNTVVM